MREPVWVKLVHARGRRGSRRRLRSASAASRRSSRGYASRSGGSLNCVGLTNSETTTTSHSVRARRMSERWPVVERAHRRHEADRGPSRRGAAGERHVARGWCGSSSWRRGLPADRASREPRAREWRRPARRTACSSSGVRSATACRCAATVASSPRATGPVSARSGPSAAQFSTVARTSGTSSSRETPAVAPSCSAAASSVIRKFEAIDAAAWYAARSAPRPPPRACPSARASDGGEIKRPRAAFPRSPAPAPAKLVCARGSPATAGERRTPRAGRARRDA